MLPAPETDNDVAGAKEQLSFTAVDTVINPAFGAGQGAENAGTALSAVKAKPTEWASTVKRGLFLEDEMATEILSRIF